ncbi:MAG: hypothetical protein ACKVOU_04270 [Cytophagales bacterium]
MLSGSKGYVAALTYCNSVKHVAKSNVLSAKAMYDDPKKRFENNSFKEKRAV